MNTGLAQGVSRWLIGLKWPLLALGAVMAVAAWFPARQLEFDRSIENMFAPGDPLLEPYRRLKRTFGGNDVVVAAYVDERLLTKEGIQRVSSLTQSLKDVAGVKLAFSLTSSPLGEGIIDDNAVAGNFRALLEDYMVGADGRTAAVICLLQPDVESDARDATIKNLRRAVREHDPSGVLAGEPVMITDGFRAIEEDGRLLGGVSTGLLVLVIALCFRSLRWMVVPLAVVNLTLLLTEALLVNSGLRLSMVSSMLWAIVTVVGIATVIHVLVHFRECRERGLEPKEALTAAIAVLAVPVAWTCFTDAAGFASLLAARVGPVQDFGVMMTTGALLALVSLALVLPGLVLWGRFQVDPAQAWGETWLNAILRRLLDAVLRRPKTIAVVILAAVAAAATGCWRLEVETDFTKNFRASSPIVRSYDLVESNLRGAGVWDILAPAPAELDHAYIERLRGLQQRLSDDEVSAAGLTKMISLADMIDAVPDDPRQWTPLLGENLLAKLGKIVSPAQFAAMTRIVLGFGKPSDIPPEELTVIKLRATRQLMPDLYELLHNQDPQTGRYYARVMLRSRERQPSAKKHALISRVQESCRQAMPPQGDAPPAEATGYFILLASLIDSMIRDQWLTFGIAAAAIWLMMLLAFRSPLLALAALAPNVLPILVITGLMGHLGLKINMGAAMIAAVSVGLAVDSSIHYITAYQRLRREGTPLTEALHRVQQSVGKAVTFATLALVVGFSALVLSQFVPIVYFGVLVSLAMLGGLAGNLVALPLALYLLGERNE